MRPEAGSDDPFKLSPEQRALCDMAFAIGAKYERRSFGDREASADLWRELAAVGLTGISIPEEFGGGGLGMLELCMVMERLSAAGYPAGKLVISTAIAGSLLTHHGSREQRARFLPGIANGSIDFCFALTEPGSGSNAPRMGTTATRSEGGWRLRGQKTYISGVDTSHAMVVAAQTPDAGGISLFVVELPRPDLAMQRVDVDLPVFDSQFTLYFDGLEVPADAVIGTPGEGLRALFDGLNPERLLVAAQAVGVGRWGVRHASRYARERMVFKGPIGAYQSVQHPLAEAHIALEAAWLLTLRACRLFDAGAAAGLESDMAKLAASDAGLFAMDRALQTHGGSGFTAETRMFEKFQMMRLLRTVPVAREIALNHVAMEGLGLPRSY